ncbi:uncharacterized protein LAJ45_05811 [Morchella importuna]|uniref:uncharacterized protein n=1 Tax=Morchella importuna TaxID=1174673 RepID=UPI001E8ECDE9|nr:uncharacterized protein LAJ45_05811 [Morchella importuna]KAH8150125.1 hypothetical protein LAJ45_05811 [Morchella importuna]
MVNFDMIESPLEDLGHARANVSSGSAGVLSDYDPERLFQHCWRRNSCGECLKTHMPCGWCPTSQACVPVFSGLFTPLGDPKVCPMSSERFELRTKPLGCNVSTVTALTAVVSVFSTLLLVGIIFVVVRYHASLGSLWRRIWRRNSGEEEEEDGEPNENTGLLHSTRRAAAGIGRNWSFWVHNTTPATKDRGEGPGPGTLERSDTTGDEGEAVGGREFEQRRERILHRNAEV